MTSFEEQVERLYEASQCVLDQLYGGMPEVGWFGAYTEYEVGAQRIAEAAHCILGSATKVYRDQQNGDIQYGFNRERGHFNEEMGIIDKSLDEYSKSLYNERVFLQSEYRYDSIESMKRTAPKLRRRAQQQREKLLAEEHKFHPHLWDIAYWSYRTIESLTDAIERSVTGATENPVRNAFRHMGLHAAAKQLRDAIAKAYR